MFYSIFCLVLFQYLFFLSIFIYFFAYADQLFRLPGHVNFKLGKQAGGLQNCETEGEIELPHVFSITSPSLYLLLQLQLHLHFLFLFFSSTIQSHLLVAITEEQILAHGSTSTTNWASETEIQSQAKKLQARKKIKPNPKSKITTI